MSGPDARDESLATYRDSNGYGMFVDRSHPLSSPRGETYVHRAVLYAALGDGPQPCHLCGRVLTWGVDLCVDHLDEDITNNARENLAPACRPCNSNRRPRAQRPVDSRCSFCGGPVGTAVYGTRKRFCGRPCRQKAWRRARA